MGTVCGAGRMRKSGIVLGITKSALWNCGRRSGARHWMGGLDSVVQEHAAVVETARIFSQWLENESGRKKKMPKGLTVEIEDLQIWTESVSVSHNGLLQS